MSDKLFNFWGIPALEQSTFFKLVEQFITFARGQCIRMFSFTFVTRAHCLDFIEIYCGL